MSYAAVLRQGVDARCMTRMHESTCSDAAMVTVFTLALMRRSDTAL
jgi:hypothetical protein